jgi:hypothetical protein
MISLGANIKLKSIHPNAFGYANDSSARTLKIRVIKIHNSEIEIIPRNLLPWDQLDSISILRSRANCNPKNNWLFKNRSFKVDKYSLKNPDDLEWCKFIFDWLRVVFFRHLRMSKRYSVS